MAAVQKSAPAQQPVTRARRQLDSEYEEALAQEAEAGFDPAGLIRRRAGRPSLSGRPVLLRKSCGAETPRWPEHEPACARSPTSRPGSSSRCELLASSAC
jgi:hypothetical protein